eukprot:TRINITY_DN21639_c0_g1_i1.p1 TRINITY_DN21639_c0_g1~~TRINITY_DN21639_c0_g1_i1.p1  ORF type:complete len:989 (+),score=271.42 TRINITY_DN21639_c0_g1_i1:80-2968(+)
MPAAWRPVARRSAELPARAVRRRARPAARRFQPEGVKVGRQRPAKGLPDVKTTTGQRWLAYDDLVERHKHFPTITPAFFTELLRRSGVDPNTYAAAEADRHGPRHLYVAVGPDLGSVVLLLSAHMWLQTHKAGMRLVPTMALAPADTASQEMVPVFQQLLAERQLELMTVPATEEDLALVRGDADPQAPLTAEQQRLLRWWLVYRAVRMRERHPLGSAVLAGTPLDRNLQKVADALCPDDAVSAPEAPERVSVQRLWGMQLGAAELGLPVLDTATADWKTGSITLHRPFLTVTVAQLARTLSEVHSLGELDRLLQRPPPVAARLSRFHTAQFLDAVRSCDLVVRSQRDAAREFVRTKVRLDYRLPWATMDPAAFRALPAPVAQIALSAVCAFVSGDADTSDWFRQPPPGVPAVAALMQGKALPEGPVTTVEGTGAAVVWGTPYEPRLGVSPPCFSVVRQPRSPRPADLFPPWLAKTEAHTHVMTRCATELLFGRWLVRLYTSVERARAIKDRGTVFWCTRLRPWEDEKWWRQFANGEEFARYLHRQTHDSKLAGGVDPTRPCALMLQDVPLVVSGVEGLAGPSDEGEEPPPGAGHLSVAACPPFGFWSPQLKGHVWLGGGNPVHRAAGFCIRPHWLGEFLPAPGLLGPLFVPLSQQIRMQTSSAAFIAQGRSRQAAPSGWDPDMLPDAEAYDRLKASVLARVQRRDSAEVGPTKVDQLFSSSVTSLAAKGALGPAAEGDEGAAEGPGGAGGEAEGAAAAAGAAGGWGTAEAYAGPGETAEGAAAEETAGEREERELRALRRAPRPDPPPEPDMGGLPKGVPWEEMPSDDPAPAPVAEAEVGPAWSQIATRAKGSSAAPRPRRGAAGMQAAKEADFTKWPGRHGAAAQEALQQRLAAVRMRGEILAGSREQQRLQSRRRLPALRVLAPDEPAVPCGPSGEPPPAPRPWMTAVRGDAPAMAADA